MVVHTLVAVIAAVVKVGVAAVVEVEGRGGERLRGGGWGAAMPVSV